MLRRLIRWLFNGFIGKPSRECSSLGWGGLDRPDADRTVSPTGRVSGTPQETPRGLRTAILARTRFAGFGSPRPDARAQAARSDPLPVGGIVRLSVGRHRGKLGVRCVRMGSRAADESAATEGARPAATRQRPPHPSRTGVQRGGFLAVATHNSARGDLHKSPPGKTRNDDCSHLHSLKRCVRHCPSPSQ